MSTWTTLTTPSVGDATRQNLAAGIIGNLEYLKGQTDSTTASVGILNGSFESDTNSDGTPDNWASTAFSGGTVAIDATNQTHGLNSMKFAGTTGGGYITTSEFFEVNPEMPVFIQWFQKSNVANVRNRLKLYWYKADKTAATSSSFTIFDREENNPTAWARMFGGVYPGSDAKWAKLEITGVDQSLAGTSGTAAGTTWIDNVSITLRPWEREVTIDQAGSFGWVAPSGVYRVLAFATGAGGGSDGIKNPYYGGGGGGTGADIIDVVPGTVYDVAVGAGGGGAGGSSTFNSSTEGQGGNEWSQAGNSGEGGSYTASFWGQDGSDKSTTTGGSSVFGIGGVANNNGYRGGGAGGGLGSAKNGGDGLIKLFY